MLQHGSEMIRASRQYISVGVIDVISRLNYEITVNLILLYSMYRNSSISSTERFSKFLQTICTMIIDHQSLLRILHTVDISTVLKIKMVTYQHILNHRVKIHTITLIYYFTKSTGRCPTASAIHSV